MATAKQLNDVMECPICTEVFTDPRVLPCVHTYCLKCIKAWRDKQSGDKLACPVCRKEFTLPSSGVEGLPKNFYVANFVQMKELSIAESTTRLCEACSGDEESESECQNVASVYCVECQMKLCKSCERGHKMIKFTCAHKLIQIGEHIDADILYKSMPPASCDQHKDENLKIYCFQCKLAICVLCYIELHNNHRCSDINKVEDDFQKQMAVDVDSIAAGVDKCREMWESVEKEKSEFVEQVEEAGVEISEKAEQLKRMIDDHREKLMSELSLMKQKRTKEIESVHEEIERQLLSMESYKKYVDEVRQKGTACDIARAASDLHNRAEELLKFDAIERTLDDLGHVDVMFASSDSFVDDVVKTLGQLNLKSAGNSNYFHCKFTSVVILS